MTAEEFFRLREKLGYTQLDFGFLIGKSRCQVIRYEKGISAIPKSIAALCVAFRVNPATIRKVARLR